MVECYWMRCVTGMWKEEMNIKTYGIINALTRIEEVKIVAFGCIQV